ncbi:hypothetical protein DSM07_08170 [Oenococcus sp. UCMA 16435]|nr:hypothetical protein DSM07_08170 [Oenococcus sp. UCMA 16435]MDI4585153.1 hypothetical protein [Oenococcus sp. UCMA 14587]
MNKIFITFDNESKFQETGKFIQAIKKIAGKNNWETTLTNQFLIKTNLSTEDLSAKLLEVNHNLSFSVVKASKYEVNQTDGK